MANCVEQIENAIEAKMVTVLGAGWAKLPHMFLLEENDTRRMRNGYAVLWGSATSVPQIHKHYVIDQLFEFILTDSIPRHTDDEQVKVSVRALYDKGDDIFKDIVGKTLGLDFVINVHSPAIADAEFFEESNGIALRFQVTVRYAVVLN